MSVFVVDNLTPATLLLTGIEGTIQVVSGAALIATAADPGKGVKITAAGSITFVNPSADVTAISAIPGRTVTIRTTGA